MDASHWIPWGWGFATGSVVGLSAGVLLNIRLTWHWYRRLRAAGLTAVNFGTFSPGRDRDPLDPRGP
jgi:hypothetical protein